MSAARAFAPVVPSGHAAAEAAAAAAVAARCAVVHSVLDVDAGDGVGCDWHSVSIGRNLPLKRNTSHPRRYQGAEQTWVVVACLCVFFARKSGMRCLRFRVKSVGPSPIYPLVRVSAPRLVFGQDSISVRRLGAMPLLLSLGSGTSAFDRLVQLRRVPHRRLLRFRFELHAKL